MLALAVALGLAVGGTAARAGFQEGVTAYTQGDYGTAYREWRAAAEAGDLAAMRNLGHLYRWGRGVERDPAEAARWYQKAALQGLDRAMVNLAVLYLEGEGVARDPAAAAHWLQQASALGNVDAMVRLADLLEQGLGVPRNPEEARRQLTRAAALGSEAAQARLRDGDGAPQAVEQATSEGVGAPQDPPLPEDGDADAPETASASPSEGASPSQESVAPPAEASEEPAPAPTADRAPQTLPEPALPEPVSPAPTLPEPGPVEVAAPAPEQAAALPEQTAPALPPVRAVGTVEGLMIHLGAYPDAAAAEAAWRDVVASVPALAQAQPHLLTGYVPGEGDLVRLYAQAPQPLLPTLCARLKETGRTCELHRFFK